jgi:hypothetical protein
MQVSKKRLVGACTDSDMLRPNGTTLSAHLQLRYGRMFSDPHEKMLVRKRVIPCG